MTYDTLVQQRHELTLSCELMLVKAAKCHYQDEMLAKMEAKEQLGEARWRVLKYPRALIKIVLLVLPFIAVGLTVPFNKVAYVHQRNDTGWFNITLKFPFHFDNNTAIYTNETIPPNFEFGKQVEICSWLFVGINGVWFIVAASLLVVYISVHGGEKMEKIATMDGFLSCSMAIIGATLSGLWCYNVIDLSKTVREEIDYVYNGPSQCLKSNICYQNFPDFVFLYVGSGVSCLSSLLWGASIFIALKYSFQSRYASHSGIAGVLEMSTDMIDDLHMK